ncbi:MAG: hypothetical protein U0822_04970 [Anaerolineae bacterium]
MSQDFAQAIDSWHEFYLMTGTAAATLIGLLFVAVTVNASLLRGPDGYHRRSWARHTFQNFLYVLFVSLVFLMPDQGRLGLAIPLLFMGGFALFSVYQLLRVGKQPSDTPHSEFIRARMIREALYTGGCFVILIIVALFLLQGQPQQLYWLAAAVLVLLVVGASSAWRFLLALIEASGARQSEERP